MTGKPQVNDKIKILKDTPVLDSNGDVVGNKILFHKGEEHTIKAITFVYKHNYITLENGGMEYNYDFYIDLGYFKLIQTIMENNTQDKIEILFKNFSEFLKEKNKRYGDSAINPLKIFSKIEPNNPICSRLDEKLQRIMNGEILSKNDVADTFGYLGLLMVEKNWLDFNEMLD